MVFNHTDSNLLLRMKGYGYNNNISKYSSSVGPSMTNIRMQCVLICRYIAHGDDIWNLFY